MSMSNAAPNFKATGYSDDEVCACCGYKGLKRAVLIVAVDADGAAVSEAVPFGVSCAAKATGRRESAIRNEAANADTVRAQQADEVARYAASLANERPARAARFMLARAFRAGETHWITPLLRAEAVALVGEEKAALIASTID